MDAIEHLPMEQGFLRKARVQEAMRKVVGW